MLTRNNESDVTQKNTGRKMIGEKHFENVLNEI